MATQPYRVMHWHGVLRDLDRRLGCYSKTESSPSTFIRDHILKGGGPFPLSPQGVLTTAVTEHLENLG